VSAWNDITASAPWRRSRAQVAAYNASLASSDSPLNLEHGRPTLPPDLTPPTTRRAVSARRVASDGAARWLFIWPAVLLILFLSIFPLVASLALSVSRVAFKGGGGRPQLHRG